MRSIRPGGMARVLRCSRVQLGAVATITAADGPRSAGRRCRGGCTGASGKQTACAFVRGFRTERSSTGIVDTQYGGLLPRPTVVRAAAVARGHGARCPAIARSSWTMPWRSRNPYRGLGCRSEGRAVPSGATFRRPQCKGASPCPPHTCACRGSPSPVHLNGEMAMEIVANRLVGLDGYVQSRAGDGPPQSRWHAVKSLWPAFRRARAYPTKRRYRR